MKTIRFIVVILFLLVNFVNFAWGDCFSDFDCGIGYKCVKRPLSSTGVCMKTVDEYGIQQYNLPETDSVLPNMNLEGDCDFDTDCPIGFRCHRIYKVCIKR
jgi:hypothetical protein